MNSLNQITRAGAGGPLQFSGTLSKPSQVTVGGNTATYGNYYITKPFSPRELVLRVNRSLRRGTESQLESETLSMGELLLDRARHEVTVKSSAIELTATEFKLLALLMDRRGRVQGRNQLLNDVWGYESAIDTRTVDTHVRRLREKLGSVAGYIETVRGVGYRVVEETSSRS